MAVKLPLVTGLLVTTLMLTSMTNAEQCVPNLYRKVEIDVHVPGVARYYVDTDCVILCLEGTLAWVIYEESNGNDRLQRDDDLYDDTCGGQIPGDTMIPSPL